MLSLMKKYGVKITLIYLKKKFYNYIITIIFLSCKKKRKYHFTKIRYFNSSLLKMFVRTIKNQYFTTFFYFLITYIYK